MTESSTVTRLSLVDQALLGLAKEISYDVDSNVSAFLADNAASLESLTKAVPQGSTMEPLLGVIEAGEVDFEDIAVLSEPLRLEVIRLWCYKITRNNLLQALSGTKDLSLTEIRSVSRDVYEYVLNNLSLYLGVFDENDVTFTVDTADASSVEIINDIVREAPKQLVTTLDRAARDWKVKDIGEADPSAWPALATRLQFYPTYENVNTYWNQLGIDTALATLLQSARNFESRSQTDDDEIESAVQALALKLILSAKELPDPSVRVSLAESLNLQDYLEIPSPLENGVLAGLMIESDLIADDLQTFQGLVAASVDWQTMEFAITKSRKYQEFVEPSILDHDGAVRLLDSPIISDDVKRSVANRSSEFLLQNSYKAYNALAKEAARLRIALSPDVVLAMANAKVNPASILPFLTPQLNSLDLSQISPILIALGGDYAKIAARSYNRPKFGKNQHIESLAKRLNDLGIVSTIDIKDSYIRVNMRHP